MRGTHGENKFGKPRIALSAEFAFVVPGVDGDGEDESADDGVDEGRGVHHGEAVHDCCDEKDADHGAGENAALPPKRLVPPRTAAEMTMNSSGDIS